ncbi:MAG: DUF4231 domain-containing protein [Geitlerinemataceae cyanobacterium]
MAKKTSYHDYLRQEMGALVEGLELPDLCKQSLKSRWLDQVIWADKKADQCRIWHYRLRLTTIIGGVLLPALVGINFQFGKENEAFRIWFPYLPFALSQVIAISAAAEEFLRFGDRWREYRQLAEDLKSEGWQYLQLSGPYQHKDSADELPPPLPRHKMSELKAEDWQTLKSRSQTKKDSDISHQDVYTLFAGRIESLLDKNIQSYIAALQQKQTKENEQIKQILSTAEKVSADRALFARPQPPPPQLPPHGYSNAPSNAGGAMGMSTGTVPFNSPTPGGQSPMPQPPMPPPPYYANSPMQQPVMGQPPSYANPPMPPPPSYANPPMQQPAMAQPPSYANPPMQQPAMVQPPSYANPPMPPPPSYANPPMQQPAMAQPAMAQPPSYANPPTPQQTAIADLNARILASTNKLRGMSTAAGPDGGNNACGWTLNKVLQDAGIPPIGDNPNYIPSVNSALQQGRGQPVPREAAKAGDLVIAAGEAHIGIGLTDGCSRVLSNSSSRASFVWESDTDFDGSYGGQSTIYRLVR